MRCLNDDAEEEGDVGVTIHYGDGVTVYAAGAQDVDDNRGGDDDDDEFDDDEEDSDGDERW